MMCNLILFVFIVFLEENGVVGENLNKNMSRLKRQDDQWSWGYVDIPASENSQKEELTQKNEQEEVNPCTLKPSPMPASENSQKEALTQKNEQEEVKPSPKPASENSQKEALTQPKEEVNPCTLKPSPMPDFSAPGRRISQIKCYEYIWNIKFREEKFKLLNECVEYTKIHNPNNQFAIGGRFALPGEFPHMAAVGWKASVGTWIFKCGSSLISPKFVLTAAHCTRASDRDTSVADPVPKIVRIGDKNIIDVFTKGIGPLDVQIAKIIVHPEYQSPKKYFDIALMELRKKVDFDSNAQPACLWTNSDVTPLGKEATVTGWGVVETAGRTTSPDLQAAVIDFLESETCDDLLQSKFNRHWNGMHDSQLCAGQLAGGIDSCQGDSGGPLQVKIPLPKSSEGVMHYIAGVTSFGFECALPNTPAVYTRVSSFLDWIEPIVWPQ